MSAGPGSLSIGDGLAAARPDNPRGPLKADLSTRSMRTLRGILADRKLALPIGVLALMVLLAIFLPLFLSYGPDRQNLINSLEAPSLSHPLGTDQLGRDVLSRVATGARISLIVATLVTLAGALVGGLIGLLAGTLGGASDGVVMRLMDAILAFPR